MNEDSYIKNISSTIIKCTKNVNDLKKIIETMISDNSIYNTLSNTVEKSLLYIDGNINTLENLFLVADSLSKNKEIRKTYVLLIESTINDFKEFRIKLEKIKMINKDINALVEYLENSKL